MTQTSWFGTYQSTAEAAEDRKKYDEATVKVVLKELKMEVVATKNVFRSGLKEGRFPQKIKVIMMTKADWKKVSRPSSPTMSTSRETKLSIRGRKPGFPVRGGARGRSHVNTHHRGVEGGEE